MFFDFEIIFRLYLDETTERHTIKVRAVSPEKAICLGRKVLIKSRSDADLSSGVGSVIREPDNWVLWNMVKEIELESECEKGN